jgi:sugar-specific transcriptional regulator TrmB
MELEEVLASAGLAGSEAKAYLALLRLGEATGVRVAQESGLYKANCYAALEKLAARGLATVRLAEGVRYYRPASPTRLGELLRERQELLQGALPELHRLYAERREEREIEVLSGLEGYKRYVDEIVAQRGERGMFRSFYEAHPLQERAALLPYERKAFRGKRIVTRSLLPDTPATRRNVRERKPHEPFFEQARYLPPGKLAPISWAVFGDALWVAFTAGRHAERVFVRIRSRELCDAFEQMFEEAWGQAKR